MVTKEKNEMDLEAEAAEHAAEDWSEDGDSPKVTLSQMDEPEEEISEVEELQQKCDELQDKYMRAVAEGENIRKRAVKERIEAEQRGGRRLARDVLSVYDNMKRAIETVDDAQREGSKALIEGIELTMRELINTFDKHQIEAIAPKEGEKFDPQFHEAMFEAPVPGTTKGNIIQVLGEGFTIAGSLVRPAQVGVSSGG
jgi:molecular chaperone GrpE